MNDAIRCRHTWINFFDFILLYSLNKKDHPVKSTSNWNTNFKREQK